MNRRRFRMLYIAPDIVLDLPGVLSRHFTGDYLTIWLKAGAPDADADRRQVESGFGDFGFHYMVPNRLPIGIKQVHDTWVWVRMGLRLAREGGRYDVIVTYAPFRTALAGLILKWLTGTPLIVEYPLNPRMVFSFDPSPVGRLKHALAPRFAAWIARRADRVMILYREQLAHMGLPASTPASVVLPFIRIRSVPPEAPTEKVIYFLGKPFWPKGVDILLKAFRIVSPRFPEYRLVIAGSDEDTTAFAELARDLPVEFPGRLAHAEAIRRMASCAVFVLPSRTEGVPRVIVEAMAAGRPVVASDVGGIPLLVRDGETGFLFPTEDHEAMAAALDRVLADPALAARLGVRGREIVRSDFAEERVADMWNESVHEVAGSGTAG